MRNSRFVTLVALLFGAFGAQSLVGRSEQSSAPAPAGRPFDALHFRPIGPASMSGASPTWRCTKRTRDLLRRQRARGVWKTTNNGTTFEPQFQDQGLISIGDVTVAQKNPDLVWVGTGESNNRQSTSWGDGVYKSTDGGKTYTDMVSRRRGSSPHRDRPGETPTSCSSGDR